MIVERHETEGLTGWGVTDRQTFVILESLLHLKI